VLQISDVSRQLSNLLHVKIGFALIVFLARIDCCSHLRFLC